MSSHLIQAKNENVRYFRKLLKAQPFIESSLMLIDKTRFNICSNSIVLQTLEANIRVSLLL